MPGARMALSGGCRGPHRVMVWAMVLLKMQEEGRSRILFRVAQGRSGSPGCFHGKDEYCSSPPQPETRIAPDQGHVVPSTWTVCAPISGGIMVSDLSCSTDTRWTPASTPLSVRRHSNCLSSKPCPASITPGNSPAWWHPHG